MPTRIAVDAMGGDNAPVSIVEGAVRARAGGAHILLTGPEAQLREVLATAGGEIGDGMEIVDAPDVIAMDHPDPARAIRSNRGSSMGVAARLVKQDRADAVFSAGSTGAALAAGVLEVGRIRGVGRPAIGLVLPFGEHPTVLCDAGANADVRPEHLVGFAILASTFAEACLGVAKPRVGLLSVGEEPGKGNELAKAAYPLLQSSGVHFIGNVEGRDIPTDAVDVVVTDGFTGNVVLKLLEGFGRFLMGELMRVFTANEESKAASEVLMPGLLELAAELSPDSYGGAVLLGVKGVCIIGHGSSSADAVEAALRLASQTVESGLVETVVERLGRQGGEA